MARASIWLAPFDRDAAYVVAKPFVLGGVMLRPGSPFDKSLVSVRRHRQLYQQRRLARAAHAPPSPPAPNGADPLAPFAGLKWPLIAKAVKDATGVYPKSRQHAEEIMAQHSTASA